MYVYISGFFLIIFFIMMILRCSVSFFTITGNGFEEDDAIYIARILQVTNLINIIIHVWPVVGHISTNK